MSKSRIEKLEEAVQPPKKEIRIIWDEPVWNGEEWVEVETDEDPSNNDDSFWPWPWERSEKKLVDRYNNDDS